MKLYDGGVTALIVIGVIYFGDWLINKISPPDPPPTMCNTKVCDDPESWRLVDCDTIKDVTQCSK